MLAQLAQLLIVLGKTKPSNKPVEEHGPYRMRCIICDELGKDARQACIGHDMAAD